MQTRNPRISEWFVLKHVIPYSLLDKTKNLINDDKMY